MFVQSFKRHQTSLICFMALMTASGAHGYSVPAPTFKGDTSVNNFILENQDAAALVQLDPNSELIEENPPGSGRIFPVEKSKYLETLYQRYGPGRGQAQDKAPLAVAPQQVPFYLYPGYTYGK